MVSIRDILRNRVYLGTYSRFGVKRAGQPHRRWSSAEDFGAVQDRLNARRTSLRAAGFVAILAVGHGALRALRNKLIGVSRKQSVEAPERRASVELLPLLPVRIAHQPERVRLPHAARRSSSKISCVRVLRCDQFRRRAPLTADGGASAVLESSSTTRGRLQSRLRAIDRRLEGYLDAAAKGRMTREQMHQLALTAAADRLRLEDTIEAAEYADRVLTRRGHPPHGAKRRFSVC